MIQKRCVKMLHFVSMGRVGEFPDMFGNFIGILGEKTEARQKPILSPVLTTTFLCPGLTG